MDCGSVSTSLTTESPSTEKSRAQRVPVFIPGSRLTGVDDPYEAPAKAEIVVDTEGLEPEESAAVVIGKLEELGLVAARVTA